MKFGRDNCKVLHQGRIDQLYKHKREANDCAATAEKNLSVMTALLAVPAAHTCGF